MLSPLPFAGPIGAVRVGQIDGQLVVNPTLPAMESGNDLDLIVVGTKDGLTMVEAGADQVPEDRLLEALEIAHEEIKRSATRRRSSASSPASPSGSTRRRPRS